MKKLNLILLAAFAGMLLAAPAVLADESDPNAPRPDFALTNGPTLRASDLAAPATNTDDAPPPPAVPADTTPQPTSADTNANNVTIAVTNTTPIFLPNGERGLRMNFKNAPLEMVLNYMSDAGGFIIHPRVDVSGKVTIWSNQPVSKKEAVGMLEKMLNENGYTAIQDDRILTIMRADEANKNSQIKVIKFDGNIDSIPKNSEMIVTEVIPVHTLNVVQLVKILQTMLPSNANLNADESANALVLTDTQANIHRMVEIVESLDTITSGNSIITAFPLKFADSKALASLIKDLFPSADTATTAGGGRGGGFGRFRAMMGGGGGIPGLGGATDTGGDNNGHTPTAKVNAVSDDHGNILVVSAPEEIMLSIAQLVKEVDTPVEDTTVAQVFHLKNADPVETADLLSSLFPDDTAQSDASRSPLGFRGFGFPGFGGGQQANASAGASDRMKKMARVVAVPDRRTSSLIVTAGTNVMDQIVNIIRDLDGRTDRKLHPYVISLQNADPVDIQQILQNLYPSATGTSTTGTSGNSSTALSNPLLNRAQTIQQQQNSQSTSTGFGTGGASSGSRTGGL